VRPFDANGNFVLPSSAGGEIRRLTVRGAGATLFAGGVTLATQVGGTIVLARLLSPSDFGLVAMVTTFSLLLANFGFNGLTEAIVQREDLNHALASTLFWINFALGLLLTAAFAGSGPLLARLFHDPLVSSVAVGVSFTILATSLSTVPLALLKRAMRFPAASAIDISARAVSVVLSIALAVLGWKYWALVAGAVAQPVTQWIGGMVLCQWRPGLPRRVAGTGSALKFAINTYGNFAVNYFSRNTDNLLVGWRFNAQALGFYKKAYDLFALTASQFGSSISIVVVAGLSRVKNNSDLYRRYLFGALAITSFVGMGLATTLTLAGKDLILALLGPKWGPAGQIFTFFGPGIGAMILYNTPGWIHLSIGRPDRWLRWGIFEFIVTCSLFIIGLHWGPVGIASAWSVSFWILTIPAILYAGQPIKLTLSSLLSVIWRYLAASLVASALTLFAMRGMPTLAAKPGALGAILRIGTVLALSVPIYLAAVVFFHGGLAPIYRFIDLLREMVRSGKAPVAAAVQEIETIPASSLPEVEPELSHGVPLVSILIPAYNAAEWIAETIRSALAQTWPHTEIIVVDDGSSDKTLAVARQFESQGVRVYAQKNQGASAARNKAFSLSQGEYIQWLDADDLLAPDKISKQMELVMKGLSPRTLLSSPWAHFMYRPYRARFKPTALWCDLTPEEWLLRKMSQNIFMQTATWLVSRELTEAAGPWDVRLLGDDDGEYFCRVLLASDGVRFVSDAKVFYRAFRFDTLSYIGRFPEKIEAHWLSMQLHIEYLRSMDDNPITRSACLQYLRDSLIYFYPEKPHIVRQANQLAVELGEPLGAPELSWKYSWLEMSLGWVVVKPVQAVLRRLRWRMARKLDHVLFQIESRRQQYPEPQPQPRPPASVINGEPGALAVKESRLM
jgi:O-antigen/teichoic acid export membrane protein/glycosyltransferase involved in cell wall biosynthesis